MKWQMGRRSRNVRDLRGRGGGGRAVAVGGGIGTIVLALLVMLLGGDPSIVLDQVSSGPNSYPTQTEISPQHQEMAEMTSVVLADTEDTWNTIFRQQLGENYQEPTLTLFSGAVQSACGYAQAAMGPFYCPRDQSIYIDLSFFEDLKRRHGAPGEFARAYVVAHEVGHHVQNQLGISRQVQAMQQRVRQEQANQLSVRLELQADCLAGVWAYHGDRSGQNISLEPGDIEQALNAASAIGDDRLQREARGYVVPESFTHGTSAQRVRWFKRGIQTGDINQCDTFNTTSL
ncbi:KPN_02809 family neutral zinc metallopeptidase [Thermocoleostomius sinensis]|jgi:predicted metalloprotease|uniref:Zinc metallopeptidase n=1 Tax=Thermocoleostomius sinensis A174 TaxID=2016057 RepID=A0A9E8ZBR6_9CYAN|nr:neutral zinc metallopeptidase [Thermocoleostomius sinensis]WAL58350.1 zinc metallopeptidase [Thermocoleostomius sinensis A174]